MPCLCKASANCIVQLILNWWFQFKFKLVFDFSALCTSWNKMSRPVLASMGAFLFQILYILFNIWFWLTCISFLLYTQWIQAIWLNMSMASYCYIPIALFCPFSVYAKGFFYQALRTCMHFISFWDGLGFSSPPYGFAEFKLSGNMQEIFPKIPEFF